VTNQRGFAVERRRPRQARGVFGTGHEFTRGKDSVSATRIERMTRSEEMP
jgi:hypothetical protein